MDLAECDSTKLHCEIGSGQIADPTQDQKDMLLPKHLFALAGAGLPLNQHDLARLPAVYREALRNARITCV